MLVAMVSIVNAQTITPPSDSVKIAMTPHGKAAFPDSLFGVPIIITPGNWESGFNAGCGDDGNDCGRWDRFTTFVKPFVDTAETVIIEKKEPALVLLSDSICVNDSVMINDKWYAKPGTFVDRSIPDTTLVVSITQLQQPRTDTAATIMQGDSILFARSWRKEAGTYRDTLACIIGCDSIVTLHLSVIPVCQECEDERIKWEQAGRLAVSLPVLREEHNDWENKTLLGLGLSYEYKFLNGLLFDPKKKPCIGESVVAYGGLRSVNAEPPSSDCLTCNNLPENASTGIEGRMQYKLSWLKGMPIIPSIAGGMGFLYNQGARDQFKIGAVITPEVEWMLFNKENLPAISVFSQTNIAVGTLPSDWRVGVRFTIGGK